MHHRNGQAAYARLILHIEDRTIYIHSVWVRTVEHKHLLAVGEGSVHEVDHGHIVGVVAKSHVLNINYDHVEFCHRLGAWHVRLAFVERCDGDSRGCIYAALHLLTGIGVAAEAVFGREYGGHVHALLKHHIEGVLVAHHAGVVAHDCHTLTLEEGDILGGALGTHFHGFIALGWAFLGTLLGTLSRQAATFAAIGACNTLCGDCKHHHGKKLHKNPIVYHNSLLKIVLYGHCWCKNRKKKHIYHYFPPKIHPMPCNFLAQPVTVEHKAALLQNECAHSKAIYI